MRLAASCRRLTSAASTPLQDGSCSSSVKSAVLPETMLPISLETQYKTRVDRDGAQGLMQGEALFGARHAHVWTQSARQHQAIVSRELDAAATWIPRPPRIPPTARKNK
jgi:hypothetical protein